MTPRARLSHKLRDGAYRARKQGRYAETIPVGAALDLLAENFCYYCKALLLGIYTLEHKIPLAKKGSHTLDNLCKACEWCNEKKHTMTEAEFSEWLISQKQS